MAFDNYELYNTRTLLGVMREQEAPTSYWLDLCFPNVLTFDDEYVDFEKIPRAGRKLAPFVAPLAQGRPIYEEGSRVARFKPAYSKPKDPVTPTRMMTRRPGELLTPTPQTPMQRRNAIIADITASHRDAIERRWEWLAAQAILNGKVTIEGDDYPARVVDFGRAANHTVVLEENARWGDDGVSIFANIESWRTRVRTAPFGGMTNRLTVGADVWDVMRQSDEIKAQLDINTRGTVVNVNTGLREGLEVEFVGNLAPNLPVYVYSDYYTEGGTSVPFMNPKDIVLTGPNVMGYRCFGAIQDVNAQFQALPIFPRNFRENDPAIEYVMSQSSPLMVPVNPNATLRARVLG